MSAVLFGLSELDGLSGSLYSYRYVVLPVVVLAVAVVAYVGVRYDVHRYLWRHRTASLLVGLPLLVLSLVAGDYLLSPLWERSFLEEASPVEAFGMPAEMAPIPGPMMSGSIRETTMMPAEPSVSHRGSFRGADDFHFGRGTVQLIRSAEGKLVLRFEDFSVRNGPDLFVYLSREESGRRVEEALNLGALKATDGAFNYEVPAHIDLATIKSAVVWCRQFSTLFAVTPLEPV